MVLSSGVSRLREVVSRLWSGLRLRLLFLLLLACAPLLVLTLHSASENRRRELAEWEQRAQNLAQQTVREEGSAVDATRQLLLALSESAPVKSGNWGNSRQVLMEALANYPRYANIGIISTNGDVVTSAVPTPDTGGWANRPIFLRVLQAREFTVGKFPLGQNWSRPLVRFGYPIMDNDGQTIGVLFASLNMDWFNRSVSDLSSRLPPGATWSRVDRNGLVLARFPTPSRWVGYQFPDKDLLQKMFAHSSGLLQEKDTNNVTRVYAFLNTPSPLLTGRIASILEIPRGTLFAEADQTLVNNLTLVGIATTLTLLLGWIGSSILVLRPVKALVKSTARLASGDLSARTGLVYGGDELGQLTKTFDEMAQALEQREVQRRRAEETLQTRDNMIRELPVLPAAMYVCNMDGVIELYNRTAVELWGYEPADRYASRRYCGSYRLFTDDNQPMSQNDSPMAEVLRTGIPVRNRELAVGRPDGTRVSVLANVVPIKDARGLMIGAVSCLQDITERKISEERLKETNEQLQAMSRRLVEAQETERRHIARELHDEIGQTLTVAEMNLQAVLKTANGSQYAKRLKDSLDAVEKVSEQVHDLSLNLRPSMLDDLGLEPALRWYLNRQAALAGLRAEFHAERLDGRLDPLIETECFRIAQEALTNIVRHAQAHSISMELVRKNGSLHLYVKDDGVGFDVPAVRDQAVQGTSLGLLSMEERASVAGGGLEYRSAPTEGTTVHAWFPLKWQTHDSKKKIYASIR